ncbi:uncharacterized protein EDB91DRAFT_1350368 [Suillus paluster]|uniref:uncharacterized protein n=1 Tax=Suillus paluster TaxID=48578 RepID=UPI001B866D7E|nr:uncharacterized protein EDB91DRAFT_1350368 [Suillus paluster]KAG1727182.1 hypothetical protein EDB91DRAFT_1350368 [Suillus paluster]
MSEHPRTDLNNLLQAIYGPGALDHVRWEVFSQGPPSCLTWFATIYIDDMNHGYAQARTRGAAQDSAAYQAYNHLRRERRR